MHVDYNIPTCSVCYSVTSFIMKMEEWKFMDYMFGMEKVCVGTNVP